jgi:acetyltransferase-like isoleucine patch superfamily enzyme
MKINFKVRWLRFWLKFAGQSSRGRIVTKIASLCVPVYKDAFLTAFLYDTGYISPKACLPIRQLQIGKNVFIDDRVTIFKNKDGGSISLGDKVAILRDSILETEQGGTIEIGNGTWIHQKCNLTAAVAAIKIGADVMVAANSSFYPHNHSIVAGIPIVRQPVITKGSIIVGNNSWIGTHVVVLGGVTIGEGAVIGAGSVVTRDIPANAVALGVPARVVKMRPAEGL